MIDISKQTATELLRALLETGSAHASDARKSLANWLALEREGALRFVEGSRHVLADFIAVLPEQR